MSHANYESTPIRLRVRTSDEVRLMRLAETLGVYESELYRQLMSDGLKARGLPELSPLAPLGRPRKESV